MSNPTILSAQTALTAINALCNSGTLTIYSGTMPATPETAVGAGVPLATWTFTATAFAAPGSTLVSGHIEATANFAATSVTPLNNGTGAWARSWKSDGTTPVSDYTVGVSGADINLTTVTFNTTVQATMSSMKHRMPAV